MRKFLLIFGLLFIVCSIVCQTNPNHIRVKGYFRKDGTYVQGHYRTAPNSTNRDNFTTKPNVNPYIGKPGYIEPDNRVYYTPSYSKKTSDPYKNSGSIYYQNSILFSDLNSLAYKNSTIQKIENTEKGENKNDVDINASKLRLSNFYIDYYKTRPAVKVESPVYFREAPSSGSSIKKTLSSGVTAYLIDSLENWCKIYFEGEIGFVPFDSISLSHSTDSKSGKSTFSDFIITKETSLREKADSKSKALLRFSVGNKVKLLDKGDKFWWYVEYKNKRGWVKSALLKEL